MEQEQLHIMGMLAPDLLDELSKRAWVLERIAMLQPIGRRALAHRLRLSEREIRGVAAALRDAGLIDLDAAGMAVTPLADGVLDGARAISHTLRGLSVLENSLTQLLGIGRACIVPGDAEGDAQVQHEVGRVAAQQLRQWLKPGEVLAVTGGTTVAQVAAQLPAGGSMDVLVLPARGGMGRTVETQADTLAEEMARRLGGRHRLLHLPDHMDPGAWQEILKMPDVRETFDRLQGTDMLVHGIGRADTMLTHRRLAPELAAQIMDKGAVAEALGYYFDRQGQVVYTASSVGLAVETIAKLPKQLAVAAGASKAEAILAVLRGRTQAVLVTDESAAHRMLEIRRNAPSVVDNDRAT